MLDLLITNGLVVNSAGSFHGDVAVKDGIIVSVGAPSSGNSMNAEKVIDASGKYILPGAIDTHTHIEEPFQGLTPLEDWTSGTRNAAMGGVTTVLNFSIQDMGHKLTAKLDEHKKRAAALSCVDFSFHGVFSDYSDLHSVKREIAEIIDGGIPSLKIFTIYSSEGLYADDWAVYEIMQAVKQCGGVLGAHAENMSIGENMQKRLIAEKKTESKYWPQAKPNIVEAEAVSRLCMFAEDTGVNLYIAHTSTKEAVDILSGYYKRGLPIFCETCPHYLFFTDEIYEKPGIGIWEIISPPLRKRADSERLWSGLARKEVHFIGSDHNAYQKAPKEEAYAKEGFSGVSNGGPGILEGLSALYSGGVAAGRISIERLVEITSENPAKLFGLFPKKGALSPGSDADIVVFDPNKKQTLGAALYKDMDWTVYEGMEVLGFPAYTILRGAVIAENGKFAGKAGMGQFVPGKADDRLIKSIG
jgi:dihydropyrimidinase